MSSIPFCATPDESMAPSIAAHRKGSQPEPFSLDGGGALGYSHAPTVAEHPSDPLPPGHRPIARYLELPSPEDRVATALARRADAGSPFADGTHATVVFDAGHSAWSVTVDGPRLGFRLGRVPRPDTVVQADLGTLAELAEGGVAGAYAFLDGRLVIRGNMGLALRLDGTGLPERPVHFPRGGSVRALDVETFYLEAGEGPAVVLLHGLGATCASMIP